MSVEGDLPKGWRRHTIAELGGNAPWVVQTGPFGSQLHSEDYVDDGVPFILIKNLQGTRLDTSDMPHISYADARRLSAYALKPGDIVFSRVGRVGSCFLVEEDQAGWIISGQMLRIRLPDDVVDKHYLLHTLRGKPAQDAIIDASVGTTRQSINTQILSSLEVSIPPKEEQSAIADVLSTIDRAIEQTEALIAKYLRIKTGLMHDLLTRGIDEHGQLRDPATHKFKSSSLGMIPEKWNLCRLSDLADPNVSICYGIVQVGKHTESGVPTLAIKDLGGDYRTGIHRTSHEIERQYSRSRVIPGDLLISVKGTTGRVDVVPPGFNGNISRDLARIRFLEGMNPLFCAFYFQSPIGSHLLDLVTVGTTRKEISIAPLNEIRVPVPEEDEQRELARIMEAQNGVLNQANRNVVKLRRLKSGLMQDLLTGKVSVEPLLKDRSRPTAVVS